MGEDSRGRQDRMGAMNGNTTSTPEKNVPVRRGQVVRRPDSSKYVASRDHMAEAGSYVVAERAHDDGDFSYLCLFAYCRCSE